MQRQLRSRCSKLHDSAPTPHLACWSNKSRSRLHRVSCRGFLTIHSRGPLRLAIFYLGIRRRPLNSGVRRKQCVGGGAYVSSHRVSQRDAHPPSPTLAWSYCQSRRKVFPELLSLPSPSRRVAASDHPVYAATFRGQRRRHQYASHKHPRRSSDTICLTSQSRGTYIVRCTTHVPLSPALGA